MADPPPGSPLIFGSIAETARLPAPSPTLDRIGRVGRAQLFGGLLLLAGANMYLGIALEAWRTLGPIGASLKLFNVNAIVWFGFFAIARLLRESPYEPARRLDWRIGALVAILAVLPLSTASGPAFLGLAVYMCLTTAPRTALRRAAIIGVTIGTIRAVTPVLTSLLTAWIVAIDVHFVALVTGAQHSDNLLWYASAPAHRLIVAPACASFAGVGLATALWVTINQLADARLSRRVIAGGLAAIALTIGINTVRLALILDFPDWYVFLHDGAGAEISRWLSLIAVFGACIAGSWNALARRA